MKHCPQCLREFDHAGDYCGLLCAMTAMWEGQARDWKAGEKGFYGPGIEELVGDDDPNWDALFEQMEER